MIISNHPAQSPVQFTGYTSALGKRLEKVIKNGKATPKDEVFIKEKMKDFFIEKAHPFRRLGQGFHESVYKIDDKFVMKILGRWPHNDCILDIKLMFSKKMFPELKTYFGETIARLGDLKILKNVSSNGKHIQAGVSDKYITHHTNKEIQNYYVTRYLPTFSQVPQRSFDNIAKDCARLNKIGDFEFDYLNPNNFVLVGKTLRITDVIRRCSEKDPNTIADLLKVFLAKIDVDNLAQYSEKAVPMRRELFKKVVMAGMRHNLPIGDTVDREFMWSYSANKLCKIQTPIHEILDGLADIQFETDKKIRLRETEKYLDSIFNSTDKKQTI